MGTESYILAGLADSEQASFSSSCHGAGRRMSRHQATRKWSGRDVIGRLAANGILVRSPSFRGVAEEALAPIKMSRSCDAAHRARLSLKVAACSR
jgi:tRNA-splicing ligase RtcB